MQNMILAVGPGSPASIAMKTDVSNSSSRTSYSDDNDNLVMVDSENDDDIQMAIKLSQQEAGIKVTPQNELEEMAMDTAGFNKLLAKHA